MNINKAQKELFNAMLNGHHIHKFEFDEKSVFITPSGYHGFVIPYSQIQINLDKIPTMREIQMHPIVTEENLCKLSMECLLDNRRGRRTYLRKLKNEKFVAYFDERLMQCFQNPKFYSTGPKSSIVVTEDISATRKNEIVGLILPTYVRDDELET